MQTLRNPATRRIVHTDQPKPFPPQFWCSTRQFSASCACNQGHYNTLGLPKNATKNQIKASYYKLSKQYHPDVNQDSSAKEKFQAVSEAYAVLGDERQRRAYDRALAASSPIPTHPHGRHEQPQTPFSYESRRRGATYAWEYSRRPNQHHAYTHPPPPGSWHFSQAHSQFNQQKAAGSDPFSNPNVRRATGQKGPLPTDRGPTQADHVARESMFVRTLQVAALVLLIGTIGHGLSANAT